MAGDPALTDQGSDCHRQCWWLDTNASGGFCHLGLPLPVQIEDHTRLKWRHAEWGYLASEITLHPQDDFQQCWLVLARVLDSWYTQCIAPFATLWPLDDPPQPFEQVLRLGRGQPQSC